MKSTAVGSTANKINYEIKWPKEPLSTFICFKVGLYKIVPPKSSAFRKLFCLCPDLVPDWLGVMILECQKVRVYVDPNSIPNKNHPLSAECNPCTRSVSLVVWPVLHMLKPFYITHDACKEMFFFFLQVSSTYCYISYSHKGFSILSKLNLYRVYNYFFMPMLGHVNPF